MITLVGLDGGPLEPRAAAALAGASCVAGALRHLAAVPVPAGAKRVVVGDLGAALREVAEHDGPAVVLASGDPGFFGVLRALRERGVRPDVVPAVSSVALAFARIGVPWDDAVVASAHGRSGRGRSVRRALAAALAHPKAAILTAPVSAEPRAFLPALLRAGRDVYVAERLGATDEAVVRVTDPADAGRDRAHPNVVIAVDPERAVAPAAAWLPGHQGAPDGWALAEADFAHRDSMITKAEVRAVALAHLAPRPGTVVWDVGAGSGSVAVECARFGAHTVAFERVAADCRRIRGNAAAHGVSVQVCEGEAPGVFDRAGALLTPDAVFVGGGGPGVIAAVVERYRPERVVAALAALDRVRAVYDLLTTAGYAVEGTQLQASRLATLPDGGLRLAAANPVTLLWGLRGAGGAASAPDRPAP
ncbi:precorrin-6y C5,15-methyltransferase (decarboxylating) subunit CbiE [Marinactinospora rubrisoli]|uniref:Precorrin-6y C5,15-methyltransferase (Decarboxylating) subunit CbiE n=1 Tax=Marinactinospora rubrisoli TaxID=2715399 RepID=A0ABW2KI45_9ACTN